MKIAHQAIAKGILNPNVAAQIDSLRKKANYLQNALKEEIEKREQAVDKLQQYRQRSLKTEQ